MDTEDAIRRMGEYCQRNSLVASPLSAGQDGVVWQTTLERNSVIKAFYRQESYAAELSCYRHLAEIGLDEIKGYHLPSLIASDDELLVIEIDLVQPPFILDFGKARVGFTPDFSDEVMEDCYAQWREWWGDEYYPIIRSIVAILRYHGIYYPDPRPGNIKPMNWNPGDDD
jgi:hypothetical protein